MHKAMLNHIRDKIFISYSRGDKEWLNRIQTMLKPLMRAKSIIVWDDTNIEAGAKWKDEIIDALTTAKVAVLLVSSNFLASDFVAEHELPPILEASQKEGLKILWIALSDCLYEETEIANYQAVNNPNAPLDSLNPAEQNRELARICREIKKVVGEPIHPSLPDVDDDLGPAVSGVLYAVPSPFGTRGFTRRYLKGSIYLIAAKGIPAASWPPIESNTSFKLNNSLIGNRYESLHGTGSMLGFPLSNISESWDNNLRESCVFSGQVQWFEGGNIYQLERFGAHAIFAGTILEKFRTFEVEMDQSGRKMTGGVLGFPISDEQNIISRSGAKGMVQRFVYGCIINWSGGVYGVTQGFYDLYQSIGEWNGELGFPLTDEEEFISSVSARKGFIQSFEYGCTHWDNHAHYIFGPIYRKWQEDQARLGFALNSASVAKNCSLQTFEGGRIEYHADDTTHTILG